ncbi:MAG: hypothetical protein N2235_24235 [Fischerella sp.]|nr:hypothetical protein [Fischerella sp.]
MSVNCRLMLSRVNIRVKYIRQILSGLREQILDTAYPANITDLDVFLLLIKVDILR